MESVGWAEETYRYSCADVRASSVGGEECMPSPSKGLPARLAKSSPTGTYVVGEPPQQYRYVTTIPPLGRRMQQRPLPKLGIEVQPQLLYHAYIHNIRSSIGQQCMPRGTRQSTWPLFAVAPFLSSSHGRSHCRRPWGWTSYCPVESRVRLFHCAPVAAKPTASHLPHRRTSRPTSIGSSIIEKETKQWKASVLKGCFTPHI
jgi:hypothetical protein